MAKACSVESNFYSTFILLVFFSLKNFKNKKYLLKSTQGVPLPFLSNEWQVLCNDVIPEPFFSMHGIGNEHEVSPYCCHMTSDVITK